MYAPNGDQVHSFNIQRALFRVAERNHRPREAQPCRFPYPQIQIGYTAHLTCQSQLANDDKVIWYNPVCQRGDQCGGNGKVGGRLSDRPVSYTHLTLPTN